MLRRVDPEDGAREFVELWSAESADDLHRVLVLHPPVRRSADAFEPFALLHKHHQAEPATSAVTAMLLVTDRRWRDAAGALVRRIAESGIVDEEQLDLLAEAFLAADQVVYWEVPEGWFGGEAITIEFGDDLMRVDDDEDDVIPPEGPALARREVVPPLRRWAAARGVRRDPETWDAFLARARVVDARSAAAIVAGLLDVIELFAPPAQVLLIEEATRWPDHAVRRLGLALFAGREGPDAAHELAKDDPNACIRAWADSLVNPSPPRGRQSGTVGRSQPVAAADPPTLF